MRITDIGLDRLADLVVLDGDILATSTDRIKELRVDKTMIDGEFVYQRQDEEVLQA
ncbi:hypothetical protein ACFYU8_02030 [Brevibacillus sp. NPDC003359]|uniref:hypothetical protein n=1 Tax=unclassified Brevibacillus TaxID=2684853 RepID=UPI0036AF03C3